MIDLFTACTPRPEVLHGELSDATFAANLEDVVEGTGPEGYSDASRFFASTYPSAGLRSLLDQALGRLGGADPQAAPVIRLETSYGGGKTHNLIALYHAARGGLDALGAIEFMEAARLPKASIQRIGVAVGTVCAKE
jgi:predicted AAA+ superfamily ATPase